MPEYNSKDILQHQIEYTNISLISNKIRILIIGGGKAGLIKAKTFLKNGCMVTILSKEFTNGFDELKHNHNINFIRDDYKEDYILDHHLVIIAINDDNTRDVIKKHCEKYCKLYSDSSEFRRGMFLVPCQRKTKYINLSLNTKEGSPKTSVYLTNKLTDVAKAYDNFVDYCCKLRNGLKDNPLKNEITNFVNTDDFYFFFEKNVHNKVLKMFYGGNEIEINFSYEKEHPSTDSNGFNNRYD